MSTIFFLLSSLLVLLCAMSTTATTMTRSKISVHAGGLSQPTKNILSVGQPRVVKLLDSFGAATAVKAMVPGIKVLCRIYLPSQPENGDPATAARIWFSNNKNTVTSNPACDFWEGYNEPGVSSLTQMQWYASFEVERVKLLASINRRAAVGQFATGTPNINDAALMNAFAPAIDAAKANDGILTVHEYASPTMLNCFSGSNKTGTGWLTGRYRKYYNQFLIPQNRSLPLIISETGIDAASCGGPSFAGYRLACGYWQSKGLGGNCEQTYVNQLAQYDEILRYDDYVLGATVFQIDCPGWNNYDVAPAADELAAYLKSQQ